MEGKVMKFIFPLLLSLLLSGCLLISVVDKGNTDVNSIAMTNQIPQMHIIRDLVNNSSIVKQKRIVEMDKNETIFVCPDEASMKSLITNGFPIDIGLMFSKYTTEVPPFFCLTLQKYNINHFQIFNMGFPERKSETEIKMLLSYDAIFCFTKLIVKRKIAINGIQKIFLERIGDTWQVVGFSNEYVYTDGYSRYIYECYGKSEHFHKSEELKYYYINHDDFFPRYEEISKGYFDELLKIKSPTE